MSDLINVSIGLAWAVALLLSWSYVFKRRVDSYHEHRDRRAFRALLTGFASWVTAVMFAGSLVIAMSGEDHILDESMRTVMFGLGAFTGAGVLSALESSRG